MQIRSGKHICRYVCAIKWRWCSKNRFPPCKSGRDPGTSGDCMLTVSKNSHFWFLTRRFVFSNTSHEKFQCMTNSSNQKISSLSDNIWRKDATILEKYSFKAQRNHNDSVKHWSFLMCAAVKHSGKLLKVCNVEFSQESYFYTFSCLWSHSLHNL